MVAAPGYNLDGYVFFFTSGVRHCPFVNLADNKKECHFIIFFMINALSLKSVIRYGQHGGRVIARLPAPPTRDPEAAVGAAFAAEQYRERRR
ncbi:hypothetical protein NDU88_002572 [Pleurodeles waltl]|uniref:Uncharacterized protein n=1 Tax=Pleurodeles waltl TaxID=8319 RepID=A0AAV7P7C9_PLEWA|nr:hypothetical protein NDU88_002572 [Pleurodeles waltl]